MSIKIKRTAVLLLAVCVLLGAGSIGSAAEPEITLYPGGNVFGVKYFTKGALVVGLSAVDTLSGLQSPGEKAGLKAGDILTAVDESPVESADELETKVARSDGKPLKLTVARGEKKLFIAITPAIDKAGGTPRLGLWVKDSTAGIGTITYCFADGRFGGLGHGICDGETNALLPLGSAAVVNVRITGIVKGERNTPGEVKGVFDSVKQGSLTANTETGVYGVFGKLPAELGSPVTVGRAQVGDAVIRCTLGEDGVKEYSIRIEKELGNEKTKNFLIKVTDKALIQRTGGIIQGMSGSPVMQNGRLVGAVTHVLVGDPTSGYGIFIGNMLDGGDYAE